MSGEWKHSKALDTKQTRYSIPTNFEALCCGVKYIKQNSQGRITLIYLDETTKSAACPDLDLAVVAANSVFGVVSEVEARARAESE